MNFVEKAVSNGGKLAPLVVPGVFSCMNPSIYNDDGDILVNIRSVNYFLHHAENKQLFPSRWGPLTYLHPENDQRLATENYLVRLDKNLNIINYAKIEMLNLHEPSWEFVGLEDGRLVKWVDTFYLIGVRRDVKTTGWGRMEYAQLEIDKDFNVKEVHRKSMPAPGNDDSYVEKNWMPILDKPFHFVKWSCPTEIAYSHPLQEGTEQIILRDANIQPNKDQRGSSQVLLWGNMYIAISHEVDLFKNYLVQKDAIYRHRLLVWDQEFNLIGMSKPFAFLDFNIEFCVGAARLDDDLLISFSIQDNAAFVLRTPKAVIEDLILEALNG